MQDVKGGSLIGWIPEFGILPRVYLIFLMEYTFLLLECYYTFESELCAMVLNKYSLSNANSNISNCLKVAFLVKSLTE